VSVGIGCDVCEDGARLDIVDLPERLGRICRLLALHLIISALFDRFPVMNSKNSEKRLQSEFTEVLTAAVVNPETELMHFEKNHICSNIDQDITIQDVIATRVQP
jgi:hypothetical protein